MKTSDRFWKSENRLDPDLRVRNRFRSEDNWILCGKMVKCLTFERRRRSWIFEKIKQNEGMVNILEALKPHKVITLVCDVQMSSVLPFFHTKSDCPSIWTGVGHVNPDSVEIWIFRIFKTGFLLWDGNFGFLCMHNICWMLLWKDYFSPLLSRYVSRQQMMHKQGLHTNREEEHSGVRCSSEIGKYFIDEFPFKNKAIYLIFIIF